MVNFGDFGMYSDLMLDYDDYVDECEEQGIEPLTIKEWYDNLE